MRGGSSSQSSRCCPHLWIPDRSVWEDRCSRARDVGYGENENFTTFDRSPNSASTVLQIFSSISSSPNVPYAMKWMLSRVLNGFLSSERVLPNHLMNGWSRSNWRDEAKAIRISFNDAVEGICTRRPGTHVRSERTLRDDPTVMYRRESAADRSSRTVGKCRISPIIIDRLVWAKFSQHRIECESFPSPSEGKKRLTTLAALLCKNFNMGDVGPYHDAASSMNRAEGGRGIENCDISKRRACITLRG